jgi:hypothetical protein
VTATTLTGIESNCRVVRHKAQDAKYRGTYTEALEEVLGLSINLKLSALGLSDIKSRNFGYVLILAFSLFFLELEGDTTDGTTLNTLHQMGCVSSNLFKFSC